MKGSNMAAPRKAKPEPIDDVRGKVDALMRTVEKQNDQIEKLLARNKQLEDQIAQNPVGKPVEVQKTVLVAALNPDRKRLGTTVFREVEGYDFPVAEMFEERAKRLVLAEEQEGHYNFVYADDAKKLYPVWKKAQKELAEYHKSKRVANGGPPARSVELPSAQSM